MENQHFVISNSEHNCVIAVSASSPSTPSDDGLGSHQNGFALGTPVSALGRIARAMSRSEWFKFLRRVFQYQNESTADLRSNPFNSHVCIMSEFILLVIQITAIAYILSISINEQPVWYLRVWIVGYDMGSFLKLPLLYWRYRYRHLNHGGRLSMHDIEQHGTREEISGSQLMNRARNYLELFFAVWFVMGNLWVLDSRIRSADVAPKIHALCLSLLAWNVISYSFPFLLFVLLCCVVPLLSSLSGYNMNISSVEHGASDDQIAHLPKCKFSEVAGNSSECCICLTEYKEKDDVRRLTCSHLFHQKCVDQWLRILSSCPLCKQELK